MKSKTKPFRNGKKVAKAVKRGVAAHEASQHKGQPKTKLARGALLNRAI